MEGNKKRTLKTCDKGHKFYKTRACQTCQICEAESKPKEGFLSLIGAPARRALERENINTLEKLANWTEKEILALHGMGPGTIPKLKTALKDKALSFKK